MNESFQQILPENVVPLSETGDAREVILEVAKDKKVDCIVVGSRGANAFSRFTTYYYLNEISEQFWDPLVTTSLKTQLVQF